MPAPDRVLTCLRQALTLTRATPGRRGHVVDLPDCTDVVVTGDLHGHVGNFQAILKAADLANNPGRHFVMQEAIHGPFRYAGGGDKSHQLIDLYAALKCQFPKRIHYIPGNHELAQWTNRTVLKGDDDLNNRFTDGVRAGYGPQYGPEIYQTYLELFKALPAVLRTQNGVVLSHSLPTPRSLLLFDIARLEQDVYDDLDFQPGGSLHSVLWGRDTTEANAIAFLGKVGGELLVTGHIGCDGGFSVPNARQVVLDTADSPAGYLIFPAGRPLTHPELVDLIRTF